jgi:hypothetical protein
MPFKFIRFQSKGMTIFETGGLERDLIHLGSLMGMHERHLPLIRKEFTFMSCGNSTLHSDQQFATISTGPGDLRSRIKLTELQTSHFYPTVSAMHRLLLNEIDSPSIDSNSIVASFNQYLSVHSNNRH